jgi:hypothetical protein
MGITESKLISGKRGEAVDLAKWYQYFAFDVLGQLLYGERHGFLEQDRDVGSIIGLAGVLMKYAYWVSSRFQWVKTEGSEEMKGSVFTET